MKSNLSLDEDDLDLSIILCKTDSFYARVSLLPTGSEGSEGSGSIAVGILSSSYDMKTTALYCRDMSLVG